MSAPKKSICLKERLKSVCVDGAIGGLGMKIYKAENKRDFYELLLLADEQESMVEKYLAGGEMYVLDDGGIRAEIVVMPTSEKVLEIKNLAVFPEFQNRGYGKRLIEFVEENYRGRYSILQVGTGESPLTINFYEKCGFVRSFVKSNFFVDNYDHPIFDGGVRLVDMVYLEKRL